jgi:hypothetical protein
MSYREENGQVILTMSREDYDLLMIFLGAASGNIGRHVPSFHRLPDLVNRLNSGNPHYTPYQVEAKKS